MSLTLKSYDLASVVCTVGIIPVGGYGEEGGLEFEQGADIFEMSVGATGLTTASKINNNDMIVTITVMETSNTYTLLAAAMKIQELAIGVVLPVPFYMHDFSTGDQVSTLTSVFISRPNMNKGRAAGERVFKLHLPGAAIGALYGLTNAI